jgi:hypothetical protein
VNPRRFAEAVVGAAAVAAAALSVHAAVNARLLRRPATGQGVAEDVADRVAARATGSVSRRVSVLVPARDEADRIGPCVRALLASRDVDFELLVLDDGSTDGTADVVAAAADGDPRVKVLRGAPLPDGWLGKPHACAQLADAASGDVLVFVDADVVVAPDGLAATVALLRDSPFDLVCPYPRQVAEGPGPRLVQPLLQWSWLTFLPLRVAERWPRPSLVAANGQLAACTAAAYRRAGGHAAVRDQVVEDMELGRAFVRAGLRAGVVDGTDVATCRMYADWDEVRDGYTKSLWAAFGSGRGAAGVVGLLGWLYVLPAVAAGAGRGRLRMLGLAGYVAGVAGRLVAARRTGSRFADAFAHPASILGLAWLTVRSVRLRQVGGLRWKGRALPGSAGEAVPWRG